MKRGSDKAGQQDIPLGLLPESDTEEEATSENGWATATRRVLLYLKALGVPPRDSLHLAQEALDCAEREPGSPHVQAAMVALKSLLQSPGERMSGSPPPWTSQGFRHPRTVTAVPPANPGQMPPARIDRRPWLTSLLRHTRHYRSFLKQGRRGRESERQRTLRTGSMGPDVKQERHHAP